MITDQYPGSPQIFNFRRNTSAATSQDDPMEDANDDIKQSIWISPSVFKEAMSSPYHKLILEQKRKSWEGKADLGTAWQK